MENIETFVCNAENFMSAIFGTFMQLSLVQECCRKIGILTERIFQYSKELSAQGLIYDTKLLQLIS